MKAVFINESKVKFIDLMLENKKLYETRNRDTLKGLFESDNLYEYVALISTGKGKPFVKAYAYIGYGFKLNESIINQLDNILFIKNTQYACKHGKTKTLYSIDSIVQCEPYTIPENAIYHGRSWCEW